MSNVFPIMLLSVVLLAGMSIAGPVGEAADCLCVVECRSWCGPCKILQRRLPPILRRHGVDYAHSNNGIPTEIKSVDGVLSGYDGPLLRAKRWPTIVVFKRVQRNGKVKYHAVKQWVGWTSRVEHEIDKTLREMQ